MQQLQIPKHTTLTQGLLWIVALATTPVMFAIVKILPSTTRTRVAIFKGGWVLLVKHTFEPFSWTLPGGGVKHAESPKSAAARELTEELSLSVKQNELYIIRHIEGKHLHRKNRNTYIVYGHELTQAENSLRIDIELLQVRWFPINMLPANTSEMARIAIDSLPN